MPAEELLIHAEGLRLTARAWGHQDAPPVLCLHGWLDNAATFDRLAPHLPDLRLVCLDLPGHGYSEHHPPGFLYGFVDLVASVHHAVRALGWERFSLMGHSLGGSICAVLAGTFPAAIERLVLLEGLGPLTEAAKHAPERLAKALGDEELARGKPPAVYRDRELVESRLGVTASKLSQAAAGILLQRALVDVSDGVAWRTDRRLRLASRMRMTDAQVIAFLERIACPTLLVRATDGFPFATEAAGRRTEAIADLQIVELPGRHHVHLEDPEAVANVVRPFLAPISRHHD